MKDFDTIWNEYSELVRLIRKKPFSCQGNLYWQAAIALRNEISRHVKPDITDFSDRASNLLYRCDSPELEV